MDASKVLARMEISTLSAKSFKNKAHMTYSIFFNQH